MSGWGMDRVYWRVTKRGGNIKSEWQMSERRRDTATVHTKTAQAKCIKGYRTQKNTANMHHQWKLTVNSQNRVATTQPRYRTQTSYILTVSRHTVFWRGAQSLTSPAAHRNKDSGQ